MSMRYKNSRVRGLWYALGLAPLLAVTHAAEPVPDDPLGVVKTLPAPSPHWMWVNDFVFTHMSDGQAFLVDGDSGTLLGQLSTGFGFNRVLVPKSQDVVYAPETYFSRGSRGERTDIVAVYDYRTLSVLEEIAIPPKRSSNMPMMANAEFTDDERFILIYNFNPAQSVTVVDARARKFVGEIETPGCALVYPTGPRSFFSICADGALLDTQLDDKGGMARQRRTARLFDVKDPVTEKGVRSGNRWLFVSFDGMVHPIEIAANGLTAGRTWSLFDAQERAQSWRTGGLQHLAIHEATQRLYAIVHQGPLDTRKDPGVDVWVYDLRSRKRVQKMTLKNPAGSIRVTRDDKPVLFSIFLGSNTTDVYDALSGAHLRSIAEIGTTPTILVDP